MHRKVPVRFGPEAAGKGPAHGHLAGGLPVWIWGAWPSWRPPA